FRFIPKDRHKTDLVLALFFLIASISFYYLARCDLGKLAPTNAWNTWAYKRNVYNSYSDTKKSLEVSGYYEYIVRDIYLSKIEDLFSNNDEQIEFLNNYFKLDQNTDYDENFNGIFKDKNLIIVLMESIDSWLVTEDVMPTVAKLMKTGINFSNHFSPVYGGGATFNSEFMVNTGYMTPFNGENASNKYGNNYFPYSLPNLFKKKGYDVNFFHENKKAYYNRGQMSKTFGYDNYYSSVEMGIPYKQIVKDTHFITNDKIRELLIPDDSKFMHFVITYSAHSPYLIKRSQCAVTVNEEEKARIENGEDEEAICIRAQARETDNFFKKLIETLEEENKLDDTVIVGVTDHYAYGYTDKERIYKLKGTSDHNLIGKVPFFIWSKDIEPQEITKVNSNIDVLPTVAYLFGLDHDPRYFIGKNIFDNNYNGYVFFNDYSWYDGDIFYKNDQEEYQDNEYVKNITKQINEVLGVNEKVLETNYFLVEND
ncbi:MAG TPA: LTA synthase family protein, partial [Mollicutes bacterium]|nr:LTA synthase family protein [Mollicutes bacterium]